jgi:hypothetical protein
VYAEVAVGARPSPRTKLATMLSSVGAGSSRPIAVAPGPLRHPNESSPPASGIAGPPYTGGLLGCQRCSERIPGDYCWNPTSAPAPAVAGRAFAVFCPVWLLPPLNLVPALFPLSFCHYPVLAAHLFRQMKERSLTADLWKGGDHSDPASIIPASRVSGRKAIVCLSILPRIHKRKGRT